MRKGKPVRCFFVYYDYFRMRQIGSKTSAWTITKSEDVNVGREKKSVWRYLNIGNCGSIFSGIAAVMLASLFMLQVRLKKYQS